MTGPTTPIRPRAEHLTGDQWGVMNETGSYPGQPWLWLFQLWYHVPGFDNSANVDLIAIYLTGAATILLLLVPFIPGLRDIPRWIPGAPAGLAVVEQLPGESRGAGAARARAAPAPGRVPAGSRAD